MAKMKKKALATPEEKRSFDKGQLELVTLGGHVRSRHAAAWMEMVDLRETNRKHSKR